MRQDLIFSDMEAGSFFGELAALDGGPRSLSVFAVNDSTVAKMPSAVFVETMFTHRPLGEAVVATLVARNRAMTRRVGELGALDVRSRVHAELLRLARPDREDPKRAIILAPPNQSELASRINTRRETVSREINAMEREGLIERRRGAIVINDALRLSARLEATAAGLKQDATSRDIASRRPVESTTYSAGRVHHVYGSLHLLSNYACKKQKFVLNMFF